MSGPVVLLDATVMAPRQTGIGWAAVELMRALARLDTPGWRFLVATTCPEVVPDLWQRSGWQPLPVPPRRVAPGNRWWWLTDGLDRLAAATGAHLVHTLTMPGPLRCRVPSVVTVHDLVYRVLPETVPTGRRWWYRLTVPRSLARARRIVVNSRATADEVKAAFPRLASRVRLTRFGTPGWVLERKPPPVRPPGAPWLFVGMLEPRKNVERILDAYLAVREEIPDGRLPMLEVVGARGWRNRRLRVRLRELADRGVIRLRGHADRRTLWNLYCRSGLLLFPSLHEGFGFPILEAMAANLPVLTGDRHAMAEVGGEAAILVDPTRTEAIREGMLAFLRDPDLAARLAARGRERAHRWNWSATARDTLGVYREVLDGPDA